MGRNLPNQKIDPQTYSDGLLSATIELTDEEGKFFSLWATDNPEPEEHDESRAPASLS